KAQVAVLPLASVAVLVTVVVPTTKLLPLAGLLLTVTPGQLPVALTVKFTTLLQSPSAAFTVKSLGHVMTGGSVLLTVTVKVQLEVLPCPSVAVLVTVVVPTAKLVPLAGLLDTVTPGQLSLALTVNVTLLLQSPDGALTVM